MELRRKELHCLVTMPDSVMFEITVDSQADGQEVLNKVCDRLGIIEVDYFGLKQCRPKGDELWLNLRNQLSLEVTGSAPYRLQLCVKFFVEPHYLQQPATRRQFYLNVRRDFINGRLHVDDIGMVVRMAAILAHAEPPTCDLTSTSDVSRYSAVLPVQYATKADVVAAVAEEHKRLRGVGVESAQYRLLQEASALDTYGMHWYSVDGGGENFKLGIGRCGIAKYDRTWNMLDSTPYSAVQQVTHDGRSLMFETMTERGDTRTHTLRLCSQAAANALYRDMTEMYTFYCSDTVSSVVAAQCCRDLKGTIASLFAESSQLGKKYVFDIRRTFTETYDNARRTLYAVQQSESAACNHDDLRHASDMETKKSLVASDDSRCGHECQALRDVVTRLQEALTCQVCAGADVNTVFVPCGHVLCCATCADRLHDCPLCKRCIERVQCVYLPVVRPRDSATTCCGDATPFSQRPTNVVCAT